jgi:hypothetical protein
MDKDGRRYRLVTLSAAGEGPSKIFDGKEIFPPKGRHWAWNQQKIDEGLKKGTIVFAKTGQPNIKKYLDNKGSVVQSIWDDIPPVNPVSPELTNYPTQKPEALLERIILASSNPGDLVMDVFAGSGTTAAVAEKLGRRWIVCDFGKHAIYTMQKRLCRIADSQQLEGPGKKKALYGRPPRPFGVVSVGAFDFSRIMGLRENKDAYIRFVMGIFGLRERDDALAKKFRVANVVALKDGHPVEVYPVWDDVYLKQVRVDEDYLQGIVAQAGGRLKGDYYIIAPETCVRVGDTALKNADGATVTFKMLTFPYKVLEEAARHFAIEEQPSSPDAINKLVSSIGFYFNEDVAIDLVPSGQGLRITRFASRITDRSGKRYEGLDALAMLLVALDFDEGAGFNVDAVVYARDIDDGKVQLKGIGPKTAVIAIDKHGNESRPTRIAEKPRQAR